MAIKRASSDSRPLGKQVIDAPGDGVGATGDSSAGDEVEPLVGAESGSGVRSSADRIAARDQGHLDSAERRIVVEDRATGVAVARAALTLGDVHRQPQNVVTRVQRVVGQVVGDVANQELAVVATGRMSGACLLTGDRKLLAGSIPDSREQ